MLELPEVITIANQMRTEFVEGRMEAVSIAEDRPTFMFGNDDLGAYEARWIFATLDSADIFLFGEMFGRISCVPAHEKLPKKAHGVVTFEGAIGSS